MYIHVRAEAFDETLMETPHGTLQPHCNWYPCWWTCSNHASSWRVYCLNQESLRTTTRSHRARGARFSDSIQCRYSAYVWSRIIHGCPARCKIVAHFIRSQLEADPALVIGKMDCKNAFNEIHQDRIIDVIRYEIPALLPFTHLMLTKSPIQTVYHDTHTKVTSVYIMRNRVPQGGSMCSAFFNLEQSRCTRAASRLHPPYPFSWSLTTLTFLVDLKMSLLPSTPFVNSILTYDFLWPLRLPARMSSLALGKTIPLRSTGLPPMQHSIGYLLTKNLRSEVHLWVAMLSCYAFMTNFVNKTVDGILRELDQLQAFIEGRNGNMRASVQTIYTVQCSTTYSPSPHLPTFHNSSCHSSAWFCHSFNSSSDSSTKFLPPVESSAMQNILSRLFLSIRFGGDGMINSEETRETAYVGFLLQCAPTIRQFWVTAGILSSDTTIATCIHEFERTHHSLQSEGVTLTSPSQIRMLWHCTYL